ncbi:uncharacterized protein LOC128673972 isoform X2 [Plodia interpunctella]|uniref:uncharacterized protein LOC128673972 isoform X2 n=1 Tax=Plodia interpunctella TaxID=58824 RepID=UPI002367CDB7|nr:uncharacterized protein LOC128673972 isoform X2 [Plodia interpunctella]
MSKIQSKKKNITTQIKMADDDEIDVLGEFTFNSCFAQNSQGIPSCSNREDTVHPQWLLDSTATNCGKKMQPEKVPKSKSIDRDNNIICTEWTRDERDILVKEMEKYGRNIRKISQTLKTKTEAEIQALIEAEHGINLDTPTFGLEKNVDHEDVPAVVQEEIVTDDTPNMTSAKKTKRKYTKSKNSLLKSEIANNKSVAMDIDPGDLVYEDDLMLGSTESIGSDLDLTDIVSRNIEKFQRAKAGRKMGNHRRKTSGSEKGRPRNKSKDLLKSPQGRQRKDSSLSEDSLRSPKMHIVLGTGHTLPVSEGEQVIKIEKKKDSEESDIEVDIDSDNEGGSTKNNFREESQAVKASGEEAPIAVPLEGRKFEPMRKRAKKIILDGGGGYTIMHTETGDLLEQSAEPKKERVLRKSVPLLPCRVYNTDKPAPFEVYIYVSALISMDVHAHTSRAEVMGLLGGTYSAGLWGSAPAVTCIGYRCARAASSSTHCDMEPVSQSVAAESLLAQGLSVCAWHHSHPACACAPSALDLATQRALQRALERGAPLLGLISSQRWPAGRRASQYRCIRVEDEDDIEPEVPTGFQLNVKLVADITADSLPLYLEELAALLRECERNAYTVDMARDRCPQANMSYLDKCISSVSHHLRSAGYADHDPVVPRLLQGIRDIFR